MGREVLILGSPQGLDGSCAVGVASPDGKDDLPDVDAGNGSVRLSPCSTHTSLESVRTGTGQHLVDTDDVERVSTV